MTNDLPWFLFPIILMILVYRRRFGQRRDDRPGIRHIAGYGVAFCAVSLNLWFLTRFDDILNSLPNNPHRTGIFTTPWPWVSALCVGVTLLLASFFTRVRRDNAASRPKP